MGYGDLCAFECLGCSLCSLFSGEDWYKHFFSSVIVLSGLIQELTASCLCTIADRGRQGSTVGLVSEVLGGEYDLVSSRYLGLGPRL